MQPTTKIFVGLIQSWMVFELALRFREVDKQKILCSQLIVVALLWTSYLAAVIYECIKVS